MSENTKIEWCDHTFNPWEGCQKVGPGCDHCYAETRNARFAGGTAINWGPGAARRLTSLGNWNKPVQWHLRHEEFFKEHGRRQRVFCASLADVFDNAVNPEWRTELFALIRSTPNLDWLLLTKRIGNVSAMVDAAGGWPANAALGVTICNQPEANRDIPKALATKIKFNIRVLFLSMEPLLGHVVLENCIESPYEQHLGWSGTYNPLTGTWWPAVGNYAYEYQNREEGLVKVDWVIAGGESGRETDRPLHPDWARSLRDQCANAGVPYHFKQWGEFHPATEHDPKSHTNIIACAHIHVDGRREYRSVEALALIGTPGWVTLCRVGKKAAGRKLDGVEHNGFPE